MNDRVWILIASAARARLFAGRGGRLHAGLEEIEDMVHPEGRVHERELTSDLPGRAYDRTGTGRHAMEEPTPIHEQEARKFVREIARRLEGGRENQEYDRLYLVAEPDILGRLRKALDPATSRCVAKEIAKNVTALRMDELRKQLPERL